MSEYWFTSPLFQIESREDEGINPSRYGRHLSIWLKAQLEHRGYRIESIVEEDWGPCLIIFRTPFRLFVGCGNVDDSVSDRVIWQCFTVAETPFLKRFFRKPDTRTALLKLDSDLHGILDSEPEITLIPEP